MSVFLALSFCGCGSWVQVFILKLAVPRDRESCPACFGFPLIHGNIFGSSVLHNVQVNSLIIQLQTYPERGLQAQHAPWSW